MDMFPGIMDYETFNLWEVLTFLTPREISANNFISRNEALFVFYGLNNGRFLNLCTKFLT